MLHKCGSESAYFIFTNSGKKLFFPLVMFGLLHEEVILQTDLIFMPYLYCDLFYVNICSRINIRLVYNRIPIYMHIYIYMLVSRFMNLCKFSYVRVLFSPNTLVV